MGTIIRTQRLRNNPPPGQLAAHSEELAQVKRTPRAQRAPKTFTGCVSDISSSCAKPSHSYTDALRDYGAVYAAFQAYQQPPTTATAPGRHGRLALEADQTTASGAADSDALPLPRPATVSEEEIENCGYLGWLRH